MSDVNEDKDVVIEDDVKAGEESGKAVGAPAKTVDGEIPADEGIRELRSKLESERLARIAAESKASEAMQHANRAAAEVEDTNVILINNAMSMLKQDTEVLKTRYRAARESGDIDAEAEIQMQMSSNAAKMHQLELGKTAMEARAKNPPIVKLDNADPVERFASQLTPRSASWVRSHPDYVRDPRLNRKMIRAHEDAIEDGIPADTDEYFQRIEKTLGIAEEAPAPVPVDDPTSGAAKPTQRRSSPPAAPVSRSGTGDGVRKDVVRLTAEEREMATMMGMTEQEYAKNKVKLIEEGRITKH